MIVLASASPRRRELLEAAGLVFEVEPAEIEEILDPTLTPAELAETLALEKARTVAASRRGSAAWIVGADTVVALPLAPGTWRLLGKPESKDEARDMLRSLSRSRHQVVTGVCVIRASDAEERTISEITWVKMRVIEPEEIEAYVASGEWRDKAGGYAIQENADAFVTELEGGFDNVVGLPVESTLALLLESGAPVSAADSGPGSLAADAPQG